VCLCCRSWVQSPVPQNKKEKEKILRKSSENRAKNQSWKREKKKEKRSKVKDLQKA
jgi:hypothetical protein